MLPKNALKGRLQMSEGRSGNAAEIRELVALIGALSQAGDTISAEVVAKRMGIGTAAAEHLLDLLLTAGDAEGSYLSLVMAEDGSEVSLAFDGGVKGRPIRLTLTETHAILAALNACGVPEDDPLRLRIEHDFGRQSVTPDTIARQLEPLASPEEHEVLKLISDAMGKGWALGFRYQGSRDETARERMALPVQLSQKDHAWYMDAIDCVKRRPRCFKIARMEDPRMVEVPEDAARTASAAETESGRMVTLRFLDPRYLELFAWPGLKIKDRKAQPLEGKIRYFGTSWLPRQLAGCAGQVICTDHEVAEKEQDYAKELLAELERS